MKTIFYIIAVCFSLQFHMNAQVNRYQLESFESEGFIPKKDYEGLRPVYYNYSKRRLFNSNKMPLNGRHFLELCRGINDPKINYQLTRYDQLTSNKRKILGAMIACGVAGYITMMGSMVALSTSGPTPDGAYVTLGVGAASLFVATPILAISSGIPHQKRKEILFRDLPEAYNFHVLSQTNK